MSGSRPRSATACRVGSSRMLSLRLAPSITQPIGIPKRSVAIDHFQPVLARSVGLGPVAAQRVGVGRARRQVRLDGGPDGVDDAGIECEHGVLLLVSSHRYLKYRYFKYGYFKQEGVGCRAEPALVSGPRRSNAAEPRSPPRSRPWDCRYRAAWWNGAPAAATLAAAATPTHRS